MVVKIGLRIATSLFWAGVWYTCSRYALENAGAALGQTVKLLDGAPLQVEGAAVETTGAAA